MFRPMGKSNIGKTTDDQVYNAGGVKHAAEIDSRHRGKETDVVESHMTRDKIDVEVCIFHLRRTCR